jgi:ubiquitin-conjugating enzyme E2 J1
VLVDVCCDCLLMTTALLLLFSTFTFDLSLFLFVCLFFSRDHDQRHFTIRGADGTDFEGGVYHGRILLPPEYPFKPPHIMFLTPSGRFETNTKICLSFTAFHAELWQPAWGIRLILEALISFLPTPADGAIGSLDWSSTERKRLAKQSVSFCCNKCGKAVDLLPKMDPETAAAKAKKASAFAKEIAELQRLQQVNEGKNDTSTTRTPPQENNSNDDDGNGGKSDEGEPKLEADKEQEKSTFTTTTNDSLLETPEEEVVFEMDDEDEDETEGGDEEEEVDSSGKNESSKSTTVNTAQPIQTDTAAKTYEAPLSTEASADDGNRVKNEGNDEQAATTNAIDDQGAPAVAAVGAAGADLNVNNNDISSLYDPLLNLMIILMAVICYLLVQKYMELQDELMELQDGDYDEL